MEKIIGVRENGSVDSDRMEARKMLEVVKRITKETNQRIVTGSDVKRYLDDLEEYYRNLEKRISQ